MSASPAQWTARVILTGALVAGIAYVAFNSTGRRPAAPAIQPLDLKPTATRLAPKPAPHPAPAPSPTPEPYAIRRILDTGGPIRYGNWFWDEKGVPAGQTIITVDLKANVLSIFRGGYEIGTAAIIYGADEKPTPLGVFPILQKDARHVSNLYGAPMPWALRLTGDGVFIHSSKVAFDAATHGCIGIPDAFARKLFAAAKVGDKVVVTRGETLNAGEAVKAI